MAVRKTIHLEDLVDRVNRMLKESPSSDTKGREALSVLVESVLMDADAYAGFSYLASEWEVLPDGRSQLRKDADETRRRYFLKPEARRLLRRGSYNG